MKLAAKTTLESLKKEFARLTDVAILKSELSRLKDEVRKFDLSTAIPAAQRARLERRYRALRRALLDLQKRVDQSFSRVSSFVRKSTESGAQANAGKSTKKKAAPSQKTTRKSSASAVPSKKIAKPAVTKASPKFVKSKSSKKK